MNLEEMEEQMLFNCHPIYFIRKQLNRIENKLDQLIEKETIDMAALDDQIAALTTEVTNQTTIDASAITLLNGIAAQIAAAVAAAQAAGATPAQLKGLTDLGTSLKTNDDALAAAVTANTPPPPPAGASKA